MTDVTKYGELGSEKHAEENKLCRQIVREISTLEVSQRQRTLVIYLLALELENIEHMRAITDLVKELAGNDLFLSHEGDKNGTIDV